MRYFQGEVACCVVHKTLVSPHYPTKFGTQKNMQQRKPKPLFFIQLLLVALLTGCTHPVSPPVLNSWAEQYTAAQKLVVGSQFVLDEAVAYPILEAPGAADEPIELRVILIFESSKPIGATGDPSSYAAEIVTYNDHHLATTLNVSDVIPRQPAPEPASLDRASMLQIGPQDAIQLTLTEGEAYMGGRVDKGNINIHLVWDVSVDHPELKSTLAPAWQVTFYRKNSKLQVLIDAQTGEILKRYEKPAR
jgi:hypothetical protein